MVRGDEFAGLGFSSSMFSESSRLRLAMKFGSDKEWVYGRLKLKTGGGGFWVCGNHSICLFFFGISEKVWLQLAKHNFWMDSIIYRYGTN